MLDSKMKSAIFLTIFVATFLPDACRSAVVKRQPNSADSELYSEITYLLQQHAAKQREAQEEEAQQQELVIRAGIPRPKFIKSWPKEPLTLGQVAGVSVDNLNNPVIFHRGDYVFDGSSFDSYHRYRYIDEGPIPMDTILVLNASDGSIIRSWGKARFYLPHGLTVDKDGNTWITDVALHQVMKFPPGKEKPSLVLGEAFVPGSDEKHFCKPTAIAVASTGEFFVSDGYCNSRIMKHRADGVLMAEWGHSGGRSIFAIPHSVTLLEDQDMIGVADRENKRISCFSCGFNPDKPAGRFIYQVSTSALGPTYAIAYNGDGILHGVAVRDDGSGIGFTADLDSGDITNTWNRANESEFQYVHDISVSPDGQSLYVAEISPNRISKFDLQ